MSMTNEELYSCILKLRQQGMTWQEVADILNEETGNDLGADAYRKKTSRLQQICATDGAYDVDNLELDAVIKERLKLRDERVQINAIARRITREETLKEMVVEAVSLMTDKLQLTPTVNNLFDGKEEKEAILQLSDLHYGIEIDNYWNKYNPEICAQRLTQLLQKILKKCKEAGIKRLYVVNLGDLISGRIHTQLRINSRLDAVTQTQHVSELLAQFLASLSEHLEVEYYDCLDNHSRLEPIKENSLDLESLARFVAWYLKERLKDFKRIHINDSNTFAPDIIDLEVLGHKIIAVHGDKDKPTQVIQNLSLMTQAHYDLVLTSHRHHFSADELNQTIHLSNGSLMSVDDYAEKLRLSAQPSQNLIFVTRDNIIDTIHRIVLR